MAIRKAHGRAAELGALLVVETLPPDELPAGVPAPTRPEANRQVHGKFASGPGTVEMAAAAGRASAEAARFRRLLGLVELDEAHPYAGYLRLAREHRDAHAAVVSATVGGGMLSPGVLSIIASASLAIAASRYLYDRGAEAGDARLLGQGARLADQSRAALLTAHELARAEGAARRAAAPHDAHRAVFEAFGQGRKEGP
jgi:hypothetical protein